jgi:hypothetical protein
VIRHLLAAAFLFTPLGTAANSSGECKAELPTVRTGYWSWRNVDGKRCWYRGHLAEINPHCSGRDPCLFLPRPKATQVANCSNRIGLSLMQKNCRSANVGRDELKRRHVPRLRLQDGCGCPAKYASECALSVLPGTTKLFSFSMWPRIRSIKRLAQHSRTRALFAPHHLIDHRASPFHVPALFARNLLKWEVDSHWETKRMAVPSQRINHTRSSGRRPAHC